MGKRQERFFKNQISAKAHSLLGRNANIVLKNNTTIFGRIHTLKAEEIGVTDSLQSAHRIPYHQIVEIITDHEALF